MWNGCASLFLYYPFCVSDVPSELVLVMQSHQSMVCFSHNYETVWQLNKDLCAYCSCCGFSFLAYIDDIVGVNCVEPWHGLSPACHNGCSSKSWGLFCYRWGLIWMAHTLLKNSCSLCWWYALAVRLWYWNVIFNRYFWTKVIFSGRF